MLVECVKVEGLTRGTSSELVHDCILRHTDPVTHNLRSFGQRSVSFWPSVHGRLSDRFPVEDNHVVCARELRHLVVAVESSLVPSVLLSALLETYPGFA